MSQLDLQTVQDLSDLGWAPYRRRALRADQIPAEVLPPITNDDVLPVGEDCPLQPLDLEDCE